VHARETFPEAALANVRDRVAEDWMEAKREELNDEYRERLLEKYIVVIEDEPTSDTVVQGESSP
jgi:hypothetical protein